MRKDLIDIYWAFKGKLVGSYRMKKYVCETLNFMPEKIISRITKNCWFLSSMDDAWAFTFTGNDLKNQHLIFLSDDLINEGPPQVYHSIAHEIGHVILNHRNSVLEGQTREEIKKQETEANEFVKTYLSRF